MSWWALQQIQNEIERVHRKLGVGIPKQTLSPLSPLPVFNSPLHTISIPQVMVTCTSAGAQQSLIWTNTLGIVAVVGGWAWLGVDMGAIEDAYILVINIMSGDVYVVTNEDHYSDRTGGANSANIPFGYPPYWWVLNANDQIEILIGGRGLANYHVGASLTIQYLLPTQLS